MPTSLQPPPAQTPMVNAVGLCVHPWLEFFRALLDRPVTSSRGTLANIPTTLTQEDEGYLYTATDYGRTWRWTGTAWERADGELPTLFVGLFCTAPGTGWKLLNGAGNPFTYTKADATTATITIQDARGYYQKMANAFTGNQVAATAPGFTQPAISTDATGLTVTDSGAANIGNNSASNTAAVGAPIAVASNPHSHTDSGHTHGITDPSHTHTASAGAVDATGEPPHMDFLPYVRL